MDTVSKEKRSQVMARIKSKDSRIETDFRKALWNSGFRYSKSSAKYFGKPDVVLKRYRTVIFIDSCFWHGCRKHCRMPSSRKKYWAEKIKRNKSRDKIVNNYYKEIGWKVYRVWEHDMKELGKPLNAILLKLPKA